MDDILQFIALESVRTIQGIKTTLTFTEAAIDLIRERYEINEEQLEELLCSTISQNKDLWGHLPQSQKEFISDSIANQIACEDFIVNEMGIEDYNSMMHYSNDSGEVQVIILSEKETGYI